MDVSKEKHPVSLKGELFYSEKYSDIIFSFDIINFDKVFLF